VTQIQTLTNHQQSTSAAIALKLAELGLSAKFVPPVSEGPIVSVYRFTPQGSTRVSHIEALAQDFAIALGVEDVFVKRMPGESSVGIFVPNPERKWILWRDEVGQVKLLAEGRQQIPLFLGVDYLGRYVVEDLTLFPHLLIAGSTGGGKSTLLSSLIATLIYNCPSSELRFVLIDLKGVEFGHFIGASHLSFDPATTIYSALERLDYCIEEMSRRLKLFAHGGHRNILEYNQAHKETRLPYIIVVIDELASLLCDTRKQEEDRGPSLGKITQGKLQQLAEKARATGIHIIAATQRSSVKIVEGNIKANFPARITFRLPSEADSRTVIGTGGAEHLLSRGDMLFINPNKPGLHRIHAPLASIEDVKACVEFAGRK